MSVQISDADLIVLHRAAEATARRLVFRFRLPSHEQEDLRQELLVDLIARFRWFDPGRGTLGVFAGTISRHRAARLANRICRERTIFAPISLEASSADPDGAMACDTVAETDGYVTVLSQPHDSFAVVEKRLDLTRALGVLRPAELKLCTKLTERTPTEISRSGEYSRASLYRQLKKIRLQLLMEGVSP
jgi:DNA-directed RNA polymerase specialized sigma24 family protein